LFLAGSLSGVEEERASLQQKLASGQLQLSKLEKKVRSIYVGAFRQNAILYPLWAQPHKNVAGANDYTQVQIKM
jgi:hypothetical protein